MRLSWGLVGGCEKKGARAATVVVIVVTIIVGLITMID